MATVNFSVPEAIKRAFNETFQDRNKSAIIAELMREAIERAQRRQRHVEAIRSDSGTPSARSLLDRG